MKARPVVLLLGPSREALSGVSTHLNLLLPSAALAREFDLAHFQVDVGRGHRLFDVKNAPVEGGAAHEVLWPLVDEIPAKVGEADEVTFG